MIHAIINKKKVLCLVDSGASASMIPKSLAANYTIQPYEVYINGINSRRMCEGRVKLPFELFGSSDDHSFNFLVYDVPRPVIGNDILTALGIDILYSEKSIQYKKVNYPFYLHSHEVINAVHIFSPSKVKISKRIVLPSQAYSYIQVHNPIQDSYFQPSDIFCNYNNLLVPELYLAAIGPVNIPILNPNSYPVQLNVNTLEPLGK